MPHTPYSRLDKPRHGPTAPTHHPAQLDLGLSDAGAPSRRNCPAPVEPVTRARATDPSTSHEAAAKVDRFASGHYAQILEALATPGTIHELAARTKLNEVQIARRLPELHGAKKAKPTEEKRNGARVWELC
jgi:hypothetical protein